MNPSAFHDVIDGAAKTIFIHVTAGDAGLGIGSGDRKHPYYLARENGAERGYASWPTQYVPVSRAASSMSFNGHLIFRVSYRNTESYFLRVPDGNPAGSGYSHTGFQSLKRLADGDNDTLAAVDGTAVYHGWSDLVETLRAIIEYESEQARLVQINIPELDPRINPEDHSDHLMTAKAGHRRRATFALRPPGVLCGLCQFATAGESRFAAARHGKLGVRGDACRRTGVGPRHLLASLRQVLRWPELFPGAGDRWAAALHQRPSSRRAVPHRISRWSGHILTTDQHAADPPPDLRSLI